MTVLGRNEARGFNTGRAGKYLVGLAIVAGGAGVVFGISQIGNETSAATVTDNATVTEVERLLSAGERAAAQQATAAESAALESRKRGGAAMQKALDAAKAGSGAAAGALSSIDAYKAWGEVYGNALAGAAATSAAEATTLDDELDAIHNHAKTNESGQTTSGNALTTTEFGPR